MVNHIRVTREGTLSLGLLRQRDIGLLKISVLVSSVMGLSVAPCYALCESTPGGRVYADAIRGGANDSQALQAAVSAGWSDGSVGCNFAVRGSGKKELKEK